MRLQEWLKQNEIYFTTLSATSLIIMSIFISCNANYISKQANRIADYQTKLIEQQTELMIAENSPFINVKYEQDYNSEEQFVTEHRLIINNIGKPLESLRVRVVSTIDITVFGQSASEYKEIQIYMEGYFDSHFLTSASTGKLAELTGYNNNMRFVLAKREAENSSKKLKKQILIDDRHYLRISYKDRRNISHTEYFALAPVFGGMRLENSDGERIFSGEKIARENDRILNLEDITPERLIEISSVND